MKDNNPTTRMFPRTMRDAFEDPVETAQWFFPPEKNETVSNIVMGTAGLLLWVLSPVLMPFLVAAVLAYVLSPVVKCLMRITGGTLPALLAVGVVVALDFAGAGQLLTRGAVQAAAVELREG